MTSPIDSTQIGSGYDLTDVPLEHLTDAISAMVDKSAIIINGETHDFSGVPREHLQEAISQILPSAGMESKVTPIQEPNYGQRVAETWAKSPEVARQEIKKTAERAIGYKGFKHLGGIEETMGSLAKATMGNIFAPLMEIPAMKNLARYLTTPTQGALGTMPYAPYPGMTGDMTYDTAGTPNMAEEAQTLAQKYPTVARTLGAQANIGMLAGLGTQEIPFTRNIMRSTGETGMETAKAMTARGLGLKISDFKNLQDYLKAKSTIEKYGLVGYSPIKFPEQANLMIGQAGQGLEQHLKNLETLENEPMVNMENTIETARAKALSKEKIEPIAINKEFDNIKKNLAVTYGQDMKTGELPYIKIVEAQHLKRQMGLKADWNTHGISPNMPKGNAYNEVFDELKKSLEKLGGEEVAKYNRVMSDLIDIDRASVKKMIVNARRDPMSLKTVAGLLASTASSHFLPLAITGVDIASKSPSVAGALYGAGKFLKKQATIPKGADVVVPALQSVKEMVESLKKKPKGAK